jgi:hypothetical protein
LKLLGLAEPIERSVIGWKPTPRFMCLLAKLSARPLKALKKLSGHTDLALVELLLLAAGIDPYASGNDSGFACGVLEQLGLVREDGGGDWIPTRRLATLIVEDRETLLAYFDKVRSGGFVPVIQKS